MFSSPTKLFKGFMLQSSLTVFPTVPELSVTIQILILRIRTIPEGLIHNYDVLACVSGSIVVYDCGCRSVIEEQEQYGRVGKLAPL